LKLVCDRERAIEAFVPRSTGTSLHASPDRNRRVRGEAAQEERRQHPGRQRGAIRKRSSPIWKARPGSWSSVATKERKRHAPPPFITSKLQQTARFPVKKTMLLAQQLYEGVELPGLGVDGPIGLITYMRTDSVRLAMRRWRPRANHSGPRFGADYLPRRRTTSSPRAMRRTRTKRIRPTSMQYDPETVRPFLTMDQYSLYRQIWNRFVGVQMTPATFDETIVDVTRGTASSA